MLLNIKSFLLCITTEALPGAPGCQSVMRSTSAQVVTSGCDLTVREFEHRIGFSTISLEPGAVSPALKNK